MRSRWSPSVGVAAVAALALAASLVGARADAGAAVGAGGRGGAPAAPDSWSSAKVPGLDGRLTALATGGAELKRARPPASPLMAASPVRDAGGRVVVVVEHRPATALDSVIVALGGIVQQRLRPGAVRAAVPVDALERLAAAKGVHSVRAPHAPVLAVRSEGVAATGADARHRVDVRGNGVVVVVVDGGFLDWERRRDAGELPPDVATSDHCPTAGFAASDHGTAVAEIIHDMAPAATLHLVCIEDDTGMRAADDYARSVGASIVNFSAGFTLTGRGDGSGGPDTPAGVVRDALADGRLWVVAGGNEAQLHWSGPFTDTDGDDYHEFVPGGEHNGFTVPGGGTAVVDLRWDAWPVTDQDFELLITDATGTVVLASLGSQTGTQPPVEQAVLTNTSTTAQDARVVIARYEASTAADFDLFVHGATRLEHAVAARSLTEPATSPHALAVGASCWETGEVRAYSSHGPTIDGRTKPDLLAPTGVSTASFGASTGCNGFGFEGTSASAPHVAGAAALLQQAVREWGPADIRAQLLSSAEDAGPPGVDQRHGAGNLRAAEPVVPRRAGCPAHQVPSAGFVDVPPNSAHARSIDCVAHWKIVKGTTRDRYTPAVPVTRGQMATFVANTIERAGGVLPTPSEDRFDDDDGSVHEENINRVAAAGIITGRADGTYRPADPVMRGQMASFLVRTHQHRTGQPLPAGTDAFEDDAGSTHEAAIDAAAAAELVTGTAPLRYGPSEPVRRDQMASFVARLLDRFVSGGYATFPG